MPDEGTQEGTGGPRRRILDAAIRLLGAGGPEAVQARKLAAEVGASTMAVYTHFGGMAGLFEAIIREGFVRFGSHVAAVPLTDNPMADFMAQGLAYRQWAFDNGQLYKLMFGMNDAALPRRVAQDMTFSGSVAFLPDEGEAAFRVMTSSLERVRDAGQITAPDITAAAGQFLASTHGYVLLEMAGYFGEEGQSLINVLGPMGISLMIGLGADRTTVDQALDQALTEAISL